MTEFARIELVYFDGCPHAEEARGNITAALARTSARPGAWAEWDLTDPATPDEFKQYGSPTVLVDGRDVTGDGPNSAAMACRADGAPSIEVIEARLT